MLEETLGWLARHFDMSCVAGVGHRIVHGGDTFAGPVRVDDDSIEAIDALTILPRRCISRRACASSGRSSIFGPTRPDCLL